MMYFISVLILDILFLSCELNIKTVLDTVYSEFEFWKINLLILPLGDRLVFLEYTNKGDTEFHQVERMSHE